MKIDHIHFCVDCAETWRTWFQQTIGFQPVVRYLMSHTVTEVLQINDIWLLLSSPLDEHSFAAQYLSNHPPGVLDIAFQVPNLEISLQRTNRLPCRSIAVSKVSECRAVQVMGWGDLRHTLIERNEIERHEIKQNKVKQNEVEQNKVEQNERSNTATSPIPLAVLAAVYQELPVSSVTYSSNQSASHPTSILYTSIDHIVLNVALGDLESALTFYEQHFGFQRQQSFTIRTDRSALSSQVLTHPAGSIQLPINEPASIHSQVQEFLDHNGGSGVQHMALQTPAILETIAQLRQCGLTFLPVPATYYHQLPQRPGFQLTAAELLAIAQQEILVDWPSDRPDALLLQTFTQPIFHQPTFFFELIERRTYQVFCKNPPDQPEMLEKTAEGFGEGNFQALFEAIEREQMKRGGFGHGNTISCINQNPANDSASGLDWTAMK